MRSVKDRGGLARKRESAKILFVDMLQARTNRRFEAAAKILTSSNHSNFWNEVKKLKRSTCGHHSSSSMVDGFSKDEEITDTFVSELRSILNSSTTYDLDTIKNDMLSSLSSHNISCIQVSSSLFPRLLIVLKEASLM